ncbi:MULTISPECIES: transglutaminase-like cysteine peptidase [unclassified Sinorhizobium]|uniref:transglutaminase-like cysteine peptidase n=1 Tax=unclassified Sinorhizobium TaxID=2613772 RepID=UPI003525F2A5
MLKNSLRSTFLALMAVAAAQPALAFGPAGYARDFVNASLFSGQEPMAPEMTRIGFVRPERPFQIGIAPVGEEAILKLTPYKRSLLLRINADVNLAGHGEARSGLGLAGMVIKISASETPRQMALAKRERLIALGVPAAALKIATKRSSVHGDHAVLLVKIDRGYLILDNSTNRIKTWNIASL